MTIFIRQAASADVHASSVLQRERAPARGRTRKGKGKGGGKAKKNPLIVNEKRLSRPSAAEAKEESSRAEAAWFGQSLFKGLAGEDDDEEEVAAMAEAARRKRMKQKLKLMQ